ncbi:sporulation protein YqfC [Laceyella putida]|uniref:Sporulation protein YqfC n=1 Tax=Laceyella putida TaxID=110101 RepID=A0ABW2RHX2_9BACL
MKRVQTDMRKWASDFFDLPADVTEELPRVEMLGGSQCLVENFRDVEHFDPQQLTLKLKQGRLSIQGENLKIKAIVPEMILIEGQIDSLSYRE